MKVVLVMLIILAVCRNEVLSLVCLSGVVLYVSAVLFKAAADRGI